MTDMTERRVEELPRIVYAGDREIAIQVLKFIMEQGAKPIALMIPSRNRASHVQELIDLCSYLDSSQVLFGDEFRTEYGVSLLKQLNPDYIICVHFPYIVPKEVLEIPKLGVLNLHPAYLPYNRGWHTPSWAIWEGTPYGATLHFMDEGVDTGDIVHQKQIEILPSDTADTLYKRAMKLEIEVFKEAWTSIVRGTYKRQPQQIESGSTHKKTDIKSIQSIDLDKEVKSEEIIRLLRALTTNDISEGAYFKANGRLYRMQIQIVEEENK